MRGVGVVFRQQREEVRQLIIMCHESGESEGQPTPLVVGVHSYYGKAFWRSENSWIYPLYDITLSCVPL